MADKVFTTAGGRHHGSAPSSLTTEEVREMKDRIKRPVKVKRIDLESFDERKIQQRTSEEIEKKRQQLVSLTRRGAGPLRLHQFEVSGNMVLYLGPRTWGQYFYEKLWLFPAEKEARRREVREAIERYIRPWLERKAEAPRAANADGKAQGTANDSSATKQTTAPDMSNLELLDKLHCRAYTKRIDAHAFYRNEPQTLQTFPIGRSSHTGYMRTAFNGMTTTPKGLSIAQIAPFKVMAEVRIMCSATRFVAEEYGLLGGNGTPCKEVIHDMEGNNETPGALKLYYRQLLDFYGTGKQTVVLEVQGIGDTHWQSAYEAAREWMQVNKFKEAISLMLVPLYRTEDYEAFRNSIEDKRAWPSFMAEKLNSMKQHQTGKDGIVSNMPMRDKATKHIVQADAVSYQRSLDIDD
jgi:hypothetical protein